MLTRRDRWQIAHGVKPAHLAGYSLDDLLDRLIRGE